MKAGKFEFKIDVVLGVHPFATPSIRAHTRLAIRVREIGTETYALCDFVTMRNEEAAAFMTIEEKFNRLESLVEDDDEASE